MYFLYVAELDREFKEDLLLKLSERYPCYHITRFLEKRWWVFGEDRLLYSNYGPDGRDTRLTWDEIEHYMALKELEGPPEATSMYSMFVDAAEVEF